MLASFVVLLVMALIVLPAVGLVAYVVLSGHDFGPAQRTTVGRRITLLAARMGRASGMTNADRSLQRQD